MLNDNRPPIHEVSFFRAIARPGFIRFFILFIVLVLLVLGGYWYFSEYKSSSNQAVKANEYLEYRRSIFQADRYGGSTPQETLDMFIIALEAGDPELATLYFEPDDSGSRESWRKVMMDTYNAGKFPEAARALGSANPDPDGIIGDYGYSFIARDVDGNILADISLIYNGDIWRIKSL